MSEALNVIKAHFGSLREVTTAPKWQYDHGQILEIDGIPNLPSTFEIHYSNSKARGTAKRWIGYDGAAEVLDEYFVSGADIWCFIVLHEGANDGETEYVIHIPVKERSEAEDSEPTPVQRDIVDEAIAALNAAVAQCGAYVEHYPTVIDGYWYVWDEATEQFVTTGVAATGNGIASAVLNADYTLTLTFTDGTSFTTPISIRGAQGEKGDTGAVPDFSIGTVTTLPAGAEASASITGTQKNPLLNLGIPKGEDGEKFYTKETVNLVDASNWTDSASAPFIPVEYGKTYSTNLSAYGFKIFCYDANKASLGANNAYEGITVTRGNYYDGLNYKYIVEVVKEAVAYIRYTIAKPTFTNSAPMFLKGDVTIPAVPVNTVKTAIEPNLGDLQSVMMTEHPVDLTDMDASLQGKIKQLGYENLLVQADNLVDFDATTSQLLVYDGIIQTKDGITAYNSTECLYFPKSVNKMSFTAINDVSANGVYAWIIVKDNDGRDGLMFPLSKKGYSYLYTLKEDNSYVAKSSSYAWTAENNIVSAVIERLSDRWRFTFVDTEDITIVKEYTFAELGIVDEADCGKMGLSPKRNVAANYNCSIACRNLRISGKPTISATGASSSRLAGKTWDAWGDSFTAGSSSYPLIVATAKGCTATNLGNSGDKVSSVLSRFNNRADACGAYVTVFAGVNDFLHDTALASFGTSVQDMITAIITKAPSSKFAWIIPPQTAYQASNTLNLTLEDYVDKIIEICRANSVPILDMYHAGGWYTNSAFTSIYIGGDNLHPSASGQIFLADKIGTFLETL